MLKKIGLKNFLILLCMLLTAGPAALHAARTGYITDLGKIFLLNLKTNTITGSYTVASGVFRQPLVISPNALYGYFYNSTNNTFYTINLQTSTVIASAAALGTNNVFYAAITPNGQFVYGPSGVGTIGFIVLNTVTNTISNYTVPSLTAPNNVTISPDGLYAYITDSSSNKVAIITVATNTTFATFTVGTGAATSGITFTPDGTIAYICNQVDGKVYPVTGLPSATPTVGTGILVGGASTSSPRAIVLKPGDPTTAYTANYGAAQSSISVITNLTTTPSVSTVNTGVAQGVYTISVSNDGTYVYLPSYNAATISAFNTSTNLFTSITGGLGSPYIMAIPVFQGGTLDTTFGNQGVTLTPFSRRDQLNAAVLLSSDKIITAGYTQTNGGTPPTLTPTAYLSQYTSDGTLDTSFNSTGTTPGIQTLLIGSRCEANAVALDASNKIMVSGFAIQSQTNIFLARYTSAGALDTSFNTVGYNTLSLGTGAVANAVAVQSTGKIPVAGCSINNGIPCFTLARFLSTGALDTAGFGTSGGGYTITPIGSISSIAAFAIIPSGGNLDYIVAVGTSDNKMTIARYTASGSLDTATFGTAGIVQPVIAGASSSRAYGVTLDTSGNILVVGSATISGSTESVIVRLTSAGVLDTTFNGTGYITQAIAGGSAFYSVAVQADGKILASGYAIGTLTNQVSLARYFSTGVVDPSFGTSGISLITIGENAYIKSLLLQSTGLSIGAGMANDTIMLSRYIE